MYHFPKPPRPTFTAGEARFLEWAVTLLLAVLFALLLGGCVSTRNSNHEFREKTQWRCHDRYVLHETYEQAKEECGAPMMASAPETPGKAFNVAPAPEQRISLGVDMGAPVVVQDGSWTRTDAAIYSKDGFIFINPNNDL